MSLAKAHEIAAIKTEQAAEFKAAGKLKKRKDIITECEEVKKVV